MLKLLLSYEVLDYAITPEWKNGKYDTVRHHHVDICWFIRHIS